MAPIRFRSIQIHEHKFLIFIISPVFSGNSNIMCRFLDFQPRIIDGKCKMDVINIHNYHIYITHYTLLSINTKLIHIN